MRQFNVLFSVLRTPTNHRSESRNKTHNSHFDEITMEVIQPRMDLWVPTKPNPFEVICVSFDINLEGAPNWVSPNHACADRGERAG
jgi:hypothetical protein